MTATRNLAKRFDKVGKTYATRENAEKAAEAFLSKFSAEVLGRTFYTVIPNIERFAVVILADADFCTGYARATADYGFVIFRN